MKTVVITGSARGFGLAMLKDFRKNNCNVVVCDINEKEIKNAVKELKEISSKAKILSFKADITKEKDVSELIASTIKETKTIDIWINNAGVNQEMIPIWSLDMKTINRLIDIDLKGTILCSKLVNEVMIKQRYGQIFNVEGFGSDNAKRLGLSIYGTAKRALTYFTESLAYENKIKETGVLVTCYKDNIASERVILKNGGEFEKTIEHEGGFYKRYWITIK